MPCHAYTEINLNPSFEQRGHRVLQRGVQDGADGGGRGDGEEGEERVRQEAVAEAAVPGRGGVPAAAAQDQGRLNPRRLTVLLSPQAKTPPSAPPPSEEGKKITDRLITYSQPGSQ